ncbi:hypothetical protein K4K51_012847 [Colletotrichum sp. SAR 10_75]|nr:hypothetical protein K4K51_012847 [Colletotrichum sp. SAR 10_75]
MGEPPSTAPCNHPEIHADHSPGTNHACALTEAERWTDRTMRFRVACDDILTLRGGALDDLEDAREEVYRAQNEVDAARKVLELAEHRQKRAQKKLKQLKERVEVAERRVRPASDEYWGAVEVMHDANTNAAQLARGTRPVIDWEKERVYEFGDRARNVAGPVGERALPSLIAAGPNRTDKRVKRHRPYPTKKDLPPKVEPLVHSCGELPSWDEEDIKISKLDDDTVIQVGNTRYLVRMDPEDVWAKFMAGSHDDDSREFNESHKDDLLNMFGYGPRQAAKPFESIDTRWGIMEVMSRAEAERRGWLPMDGSA